MTIEDIKNFLGNEQLKLLKMDCKYPSRLKFNKYIINKLLINYQYFNKLEIIYLLKNKNNLENLHIFCPVCGKKNVFNNLKRGYSQYCCAKHANSHNRDKAKETWKRLYGVDNPNKCKKIRLKIENTNIKKYGYKCNWASPDPKLNGKATREKLYGVDNLFKSKDPKLNGRATIKEKYGYENFSKTKMYKDMFKDKEFVRHKQQKQYETKKKNGTFNTSIPEQKLYNKLKLKFPDVIHQYKDNKRYPFICDFYIPSKDLFIELNFHWTHGKEPFDKNNKNHLEILEKWKLKNNKFYNNAIYCWTLLDVKKLETFKKNKLNYKIFYKESKFSDWFQSF